MNLNEVCHFRLITGEELVSPISAETEAEYILTNPMVMEWHDNEKGRIMMLATYMPYASRNEIIIQKAHVITCSDVNAEMEKHYYLSCRINKKLELNNMKALTEINQMMEETLVGLSVPRYQISSDKIH